MLIMDNAERDNKNVSIPDIMETEASKSNDPSKDIVPTVKGVDEEAINKLSKGFQTLYAEDLKSISEPLDEIRRNQEVLLETMCQESSRFVEAKESLKLDEMFSMVAQYHSKLVNIKKDMITLHEKMAKLKKRASKLQQMKQKRTSSSPGK